MKTLTALIAATLSCATLAHAQTAPAQATPPAAVTPARAAPMGYGPAISAAEARRLIDRTIAVAEARGFRMAVAVVEPSGELIAFTRMDDTQYGSTLVAQNKAWSAARYRTSTAAMEERVQGGRMVTLANDDALPIAGGVPIVVDGKVVGALGVSGAAAADDQAVAMEALAGR